MTPRVIKRYGLTEVQVPNGRIIRGYQPGFSKVHLVEHVLRDRLAEQIKGITEAHLGFGYADVLTAEKAVEVEPGANWRHGARQSLQYAAQTGCQPTLALFGYASSDDIYSLYKRLLDSPQIELWWWAPSGRPGEGYWERITSRSSASSVASRVKSFDIGIDLPGGKSRVQRAEELRAEADRLEAEASDL